MAKKTTKKTTKKKSTTRQGRLDFPRGPEPKKDEPVKSPSELRRERDDRRKALELSVGVSAARGGSDGDPRIEARAREFLRFLQTGEFHPKTKS